MESLVYNLIYITGLLSIGVTWLILGVIVVFGIKLIGGMYGRQD